VALEQGESRAEIERLIAINCPPDRTGDCTCAELFAELKNALEMVAYALAIIALVVPMARILRTLVVLAAKQIPSQLEKQAETAAKQLEDLSGQRPIIEGEFQRIQEKQLEVAHRMGEVVIKP